MSWCYMPLLIRVAMKKENYIALLKEASNLYRKTYLRKHYLFDGKYFTLDSCEMDSFGIYNEARLVAKYADPTEDSVGLIYTEGSSFSFDDLHFRNGEYFTVKNECSIKNKEKAYQKRKKDFLSSFPKTDIAAHLTDDDIEAVLMADIAFKEYRCIGIELDALDAIFRRYGQLIKDVYLDMGCAQIGLQNSEIAPDSILTAYFGCDRVYMFCNDTDQSFPNSIMLLLYGPKSNKEYSIKKPIECEV